MWVKPRTTKHMAMVSTHLVIIVTRESLRMDKGMAKASIILRMVTYMMVNSRIVKEMASVC
jgi:hypothetical protein